MLKIEKTVLASPEQMEIIIEGMRNPQNSWAKIDSSVVHIEDPDTLETAGYQLQLGDNDHDLMLLIASSGSVHAKYRRMIPVIATINAPLYWWKAFDSYKIGTVSNSCSTMHSILEKPFTIDDFSTEHLVTKKEAAWGDPVSKNVLELVIDSLNTYRKKYLDSRKPSYIDEDEYSKEFWWQIVQLLPASYNQKRTIMLNYEVLSHIYRDRKNHKLDEWRIFCEWIENLPFSDLIIPDDGFIIGFDPSINFKNSKKDDRNNG